MDNTLIEEYRNNILECSHRGHICVVNDQGSVVNFVGDPHYISFTRSAAKPLQAIPGVRGGIISHYGFTEQEVAIMTASHRSEPDHVVTLQSIMDKIEVTEQKLVCAPSWPLNSSAREQVIRELGSKRRLYHNCSGKHLGVLAYSKLKGYQLEHYDALEHPVQQEIIKTIAYMTNLPVSSIGLGIDGCGFPVFALPMSSLATAYMKLIAPDRIEDIATREAVQVITKAMNHYPQMVAGNGRVDSILLQDPNILAKGGFKGVYCFGLRKERVGVAFKVVDGSEEEWGRIVLSILEQLDYDNQETMDKLKEAFPKTILNDAKVSVGHVESVFQLSHNI